MNADPLFDARALDQIVTASCRPFLVCDQGGVKLYVHPLARDALIVGGPSGPRNTLRDLRCDEQSRVGLEAGIADMFRHPERGDLRVGSQYDLRPLHNSANCVIGVILELIGDEMALADMPRPSDNEDRYKTLVEASSQGIIVHRNDRVLYANQAAASVLGYETPGEVCRLTSIDDYVHPDDRASTRAYRSSRGRGEWAPDDYEFRAIRKDGATAWINCRPTIIDWEGKPAFQVTFFDVTERKRAMEAVARADSRFRELLEQAAVGILIRRADKVVFANRAIATMLGHDHPQDLIDVGVVALLEAERGMASRSHDASSGAQLASTYLEFEGRRQDGDTVWVGCWGQPVVWDDENALLSILVDISERKRLEEEVRNAHRMDAVGRLAGGLAHEVNNILAVVLGHLDITKQAAEERDVTDEHLDKAIQSVSHGTALAQRILAISERGYPTTRVIDVNRTAMSVVGLLTGLLGPDIEIETKCADQVWPVKADPYEAEAALLNLAFNSRDAMSNGGVLRVCTENVSVERMQAAKHEKTAPGDYVLVLVMDDGPGMPPEIAARAFEPFFTTKPPGKGTGLGLSMVHGFATRSGGFAELDSRPGSGTRVNLYLPRADD